jgi:hypothetical protein
MVDLMIWITAAMLRKLTAGELAEAFRKADRDSSDVILSMQCTRKIAYALRLYRVACALRLYRGE